MPRRTSRRLGLAAALLTGALAPAPAHAAPAWQPFGAPLFTVPGPMAADVASVDLDPSGRGALVFGTADGVTLTEIAGPAAEPVSRTLVAAPAQTARVAVVPGSAETVAAWADASGIHVRTRAAGAGELSTPADLAGSVASDFDLAALADGSVLLAQPDGTRANVWRRRAGETAFAPLADVDGTGTVDRVVLRAAPGGAALLGLDTRTVTSEIVPPFPTTITTHRNRVARLAAGDPGFGPAEDTGPTHVVSSNVFSLASGAQSVDDMVERAGGAIDVALRRTTSSAFDGTTSSGLLARRTAGGTWSTTAVLASGEAPLASQGGGVSPLRLLAPGGDPVLVWTQGNPDPGGQIATELRASWGTFTTSQPLDTAPATSALRLLDADDLDDGRGLALVAEGETVRAVTFGPAGAVLSDEPLTAGTGAVRSGFVAADGAGAALATVTRTSAAGTTGFATVLSDPGAPEGPGTPGGPGAPGGPGGSGTGGGGGTGGAVKPAGPGGGVAKPDTRAPALSGIGLSRMTFTTRGRRKGTKLTWVSSEAGRLLVGVERAVRGWRSGGSCVARKPRRGTARRCTSYRSLGALRVALPEDEGALTFAGKVAGKTLTPGRYRFSLVAVDAAGNRSEPRTINFTIVR